MPLTSFDVFAEAKNGEYCMAILSGTLFLINSLIIHLY